MAPSWRLHNTEGPLVHFLLWPITQQINILYLLWCTSMWNMFCTFSWNANEKWICIWFVEVLGDKFLSELIFTCQFSICKMHYENCCVYSITQQINILYLFWCTSMWNMFCTFSCSWNANEKWICVWFVEVLGLFGWMDGKVKE